MIRSTLFGAVLAALVLTLVTAPVTDSSAQAAAKPQKPVALAGGWTLCVGDECRDHPVLDVSTGPSSTCVVAAGTSSERPAVWCWGRSVVGVTGTIGTTNKPTRVPVPGVVSAVRVGADHACAISAVNNQKGTVWCWGSNYRGELGTTNVARGSSTVTPQQVMVNGQPLRGATDIHAGWSTSCALTLVVRCWGWSQGPNWSDTVEPRTLDVPSPKAFASSTGPAICLLAKDGLYCQSASDEEYLLSSGVAGLDVATCDANRSCNGVAFRRKTGTTAQTTVAATGRFRGCAVTAGKLSCWGGNSSEKEGFNLAPEEVDESTAVPGGVRFNPDKPGKWVEETSNVDKRLGTRSKKFNEPNPVPVVQAPSSVTTLGAGAGFSCATSGGFIWCWGRNDWGQVGVKPSTSIKTKPKQLDITTSDPFTRVSGGAAHACALASDGDLWCWGSNVVRQANPTRGVSTTKPVQLTFLPPA